MSVYDCVVIGAGPAGLAYASTIKKQESVLVVDLGKSVEMRKRDNPDECVLGAGGAGLFSDGKFSFYPSGTKIWEHDATHLRIAYDMLKTDLAPFKKIPSFPKIDSKEHLKRDLGNWAFKYYPSAYLSLSNRIALIQKLAKRCLHMSYETEFIRFTLVAKGYRVEIKDVKAGSLDTILAKQIVFAGGRFMPRFLDCPKQFRRYEFGFRVEAPSYLFPKKNSVDPKYILEFEDQGIECRTFCWCENGEVAPTQFKDIQTYSGRADCQPTGKNNFGFNFRVKDAAILTDAVFNEVMHTKVYKEKLVDLTEVLDHFPNSLKKIVSYGISQLITLFPTLNSDEVYVLGPTIEGVGEYPAINKDSCIEGLPNVYAIGDCNGTYRGIVASMLSGYLLASKHNTENL
ncbi:MAG: hypothetical protein WCF65_05595 [Parachlamydiaceae bacterium]